MSSGFFDTAPANQKGLFGFDDEFQYQMVPAGQSRFVGVKIFLNEPTDVEVFIDDTSIATVGNFITTRAGSGITTTPRGFRMPKDSEAIMEIKGVRHGRTRVLVVPVGGGEASSVLMISVKNKFTVTYQLGVVSDAIHVPNKEGVGNNLANNMLAAAALWNASSNIELKRVGSIMDVVVPGDLGDPIFMDTFEAPTRIALAASILRTFIPANIYVFGTWNIEYHSKPGVGGNTFFNLCYLENALTGVTGGLLAAHEIGHALGLEHSFIPNPDLLMTDGGIQNAKMMAGEIEVANRAL